MKRPMNEYRLVRDKFGFLAMAFFDPTGKMHESKYLLTACRRIEDVYERIGQYLIAADKPVVNLEELNSMYMDNTLVRLDELMTLVRHENKQQVLKWGVRKATAFEWMTYLTKEAGELAEAVAKHEYSKETDTQKKPKKKAIVNEAIQVATVALKIAEIYLEFVEENDGT